MKQHMTIEEIEKEAANGHATADQLDLLVSNTRELAHQRESELNKLEGLLEKLEARLQDKT
jgi:hypothetical protein